MVSLIARGTVLSFSPETISIGPRPGLTLLTFASVQGLKLAAAAWKTCDPGAGTAKVSNNSVASVSETALAKEYRNWLKVSGTARCRSAGLPGTGAADRNAETGS